MARIKRLYGLWGEPQTTVDATGLGSVVVDDLRDAGVVCKSFILTSKTKNDVLGWLAADFEQERLTFFPHDQTIREAKGFERKMLPSGSWRLEGGPGFHDDCVIALALLNDAMGRTATGDMPIGIPSTADWDHNDDGLDYGWGDERAGWASKSALTGWN